MKINCSHLIIVSARGNSVGAELMETLAQKMLTLPFLERKRLNVIAMTDTRDEGPAKSAWFLYKSLIDKRSDAALEQSDVRPMSCTEDVTDEHVKTLLKMGLLRSASSATKIPIIFADTDCAVKMPRIFICDVLKWDCMNRPADLILNPGDAVVIDCATAHKTFLRAELPVTT